VREHSLRLVWTGSTHGDQGMLVAGPVTDVIVDRQVRSAVCARASARFQRWTVSWASPRSSRCSRSCRPGRRTWDRIQACSSHSRRSPHRRSRPKHRSRVAASPLSASHLFAVRRRADRLPTAPSRSYAPRTG
jgi:hypothetical protein